MKKTIWKYPLKVTDLQTIKAAPGKVLSVAIQDETLCLWVEVDPNGKKLVDRTFVVVGTGHHFEDDDLAYLGTAQMMGGILVWHVYEKFETKEAS